MTIQAPSSPFVTVDGRPRLTPTSVALGATIRNRARRSELSCGYCWPGETYEIGFQSSLGGGRVAGAGDASVWAAADPTSSKGARTRTENFNFMRVLGRTKG